MQAGVSFEREAMHRLPQILGDLLNEVLDPSDVRRGTSETGVDAIGDARGRRWLFEVKSSSRPGVVAKAADQLAAVTRDDAIPVLVVPFMTPAGAKSAAQRSLNWLDLSGNAHLRTDDGLYIHIEGRPGRAVHATSSSRSRHPCTSNFGRRCAFWRVADQLPNGLSRSDDHGEEYDAAQA